MPILTQVNLGGLLAWEFLLMHWVEVRRWQVIAGNSTGEASKSGSEIFFVTALLSESLQSLFLHPSEAPSCTTAGHPQERLRQ